MKYNFEYCHKCYAYKFLSCDLYDLDYHLIFTCERCGSIVFNGKISKIIKSEVGFKELPQDGWSMFENMEVITKKMPMEYNCLFYLEKLVDEK